MYVRRSSHVQVPVGAVGPLGEAGPLGDAGLLGEVVLLQVVLVHGEDEQQVPQSYS